MKNVEREREKYRVLLSFIDGLLEVAKSEERETKPTTPAIDPLPVPVPGVASLPEPSTSGVSERNVFVVYGRNEAARKAMFEFLRSVGLNPKEWDDLIAAHGEGTPHPRDVILSGFSNAQAVVVLMTPDDDAQLNHAYRSDHEEDFETNLTGQPRQNVLIEAGIALGMHPKRTIIVEMGKLRPVSDIGGLHTIRMNGSEKARNSLVTRLQTAGCPASKNSSDWLTAGDFASVLEDIKRHAKGPTNQEDSTDEKPKLFESEGILWAVKDVGGVRTYAEHCPRCGTAMRRQMDFVTCRNPKCGHEVLLMFQQPRSVPSEHQ